MILKEIIFCTFAVNNPMYYDLEHELAKKDTAVVQNQKQFGRYHLCCCAAGIDFGAAVLQRPPCGGA